MANVDEVLNFVKETITEIKDVDENLIAPNTRLEEIELDSLDYVEVQLAVRKKYDVSVEQDLFVNGTISTIGEFCNYIANASQGAKVPVKGAA
jgi:acyl carrier protein